jgi:SHS2 domain-containing protein
MLGLMGLASEGEGAQIRELSVTGIDREDLLVGWLTELLYLVDKYEIGISKIELTVTGDTKVAAIIHEIPSQMPQREIKAVTYHGLEVLELENGLEATIVFDV